MNQLETYKGILKDQDRMYTRLSYLYDSATQEEKDDGLGWYARAHELAKSLAVRYGFTVSTASGVLAALSAGVSWTQNVKDAETLLGAVAAGETDWQNVPASTYPLMLERAHRIAMTGDVSELGNGLKTTSFLSNILGIWSHRAVTVDRHMLGAAVGSRSTEHQKISLTEKRYFAISDALQRLAKNRGIEPRQAQAVVWVTYRRRLGLS